MCLAFLAKCAELGVPLMITCTYRSQKEQDDLYAQGRTKPGNKVTWVRTSKHSFTLKDGTPAAKAFDIAVLRDGKPIWDLKADVDKNGMADYRQVGEIGRKLGMRVGIDFGDAPHFEFIG